MSMSKYAAKVARREGRIPNESRVDFGILDASDEPGLWDELLEQPGAVWEHLEDPGADVWLNSDNDPMGPLVIVIPDGAGHLELVGYDRGQEVAAETVREPRDWFAGPYETVISFWNRIQLAREQVR